MPLYKDASGQLIIAASLPPGGSNVANPDSVYLADMAPWLRGLDAPDSLAWHPANYHDGAESGNVDVLSDITTETGTLTVGGGSYIKSGQTAFDTGTGFWLEGGDNPKLSIGSAVKGVTWDGSAFTVRGDVIATGNMDLNAAARVVNVSLTSPTSIPTGSSWTTVTGTIALPAVTDSSERDSAIFLFDLYLEPNVSSNIKWYIKLQYSNNGGSTWFDAGPVWNVKLLSDSGSVFQDVSVIGYRALALANEYRFRLQAYHTSSGTKSIGSVTDGYCQLIVLEKKR